MLKLIFICFLLMNNVILARASHYDTLGISKQATLPEIREAYKKLAMKFHPDKNPDQEVQKNFLKITEAYETLKDRQKRLHYDVLGSHSYTRTYNFQAEDYEHKFYNGLYYDDPNVDTLTSGNFSDYFQDGCYFINFYSPFCPPCQVLSEHWKKLAEVYKGIVKVAAVNCKYHSSLCSETMKIRQYPSLLFYSIGITATANYTYYQGAHNFDALDRYVLNYLKTRVRVATVNNVMSIQSPVAYVLDAKKIGVTAIYRIAYHLNKIVTVVTVKDHSLRAKLTKDKDTTVVVRYNGINKDIQSKKEKHVLTDIVESLPRVEDIDPDEFQTIITNLLGVHGKSWVLHLSSKGRDRLLLYRLKMEFPDVNYGEIDCGRWKDLCVSLEMETLPAWGILKVDGAFQLVPSDADVRIYIEAATISDVIRPVSASTIEEIVRGKKGPWVLLVIPHKMHCHRTFEAFTKLSKMYSFSKDIRFGIVSCTEDTEAKCRKVHLNKPSIMGLTHNARRYFDGYPLLTDLIEYIQEILYIPDVELNESQVMEIIGESDRAVSWMLAFMPAGCGHECEELMKEWKIAAAKLGPLQSVRVGALQCASAAGLCANVRAPTARLYPALATEYHSNKLQLIAKAELMMEWALELLDDSIQTLDVKSFQRTVGSVETSDKPWIVYFHSPSCYRCHEMYKDFVLTSIFLKTKVHAGKVDCSAYREMCRRESVNAYPSLQLYLAGRPHQNSNSILITVEHYVVLLNAVTHLIKLHEDPISAVETDRVRHDEL